MRYSVEVKGIVQGVGFRPFVYRLAKSLSLGGFVRNTADGLSIEVEGTRELCDRFVASIGNDAPPLSLVTDINTQELEDRDESDFIIIPSSDGAVNTFISPDIGVCDECINDINSEENRRYNYAFTNCTNCGPRFTIIEDIPYDRKSTTMSDFTMCPKCQEEYENPDDRRFHAQPNACPVCGPELSFYRDGVLEDDDPISLFNEAVKCGEIVAVKGIGGYHLACDAENPLAVKILRERKQRHDKPFAVMLRDIETVKKYCSLNEAEEKALLSPRKPILLLKKKKECSVAYNVTLKSKKLGVMLPYTPLHSMLMRENDALVMTSGNVADSPMITDDEEALSVLLWIADAVLTHNRRILRRMDDSVAVVVNDKLHLLRRARGYVPEPLYMPDNDENILALGAQLKNTFCLVKGENAFMSGYMGDLDDEKTTESVKKEINSFIKIFGAMPKTLVCDVHPDYITTRFAERMRNEYSVIKVQHHQAHFASVLAEHVIQDDAIGIIFDGLGYGDDGRIWGGEFLYGNIRESRRMGHLLYFPLLGGKKAIIEPYRTALAVCEAAVGKPKALSIFPQFCQQSEILLKAAQSGLNSVKTSSMGRLFDAVAGIIGLRTVTTYEGQAAVELQQIIDKHEEAAYSFEHYEEDEQMIIDWRPVIAAVVDDLDAGVNIRRISSRFHNAVTALIVESCVELRVITKCDKVALSGGVFQNDYIMSNSIKALEAKGFEVYTNEKIPVNDGGISFGQAAVAAQMMR